MRRILLWPERLPESLGGFARDLSRRLDASVVVVAAFPDLASSSADVSNNDAVVLVPDAALASGEATIAQVMAAIQAVAASDLGDLVVVVGDGYLGTDNDTLVSATAAAACITTIRSMAVRLGGRRRANAVCVPDTLFGNQSSQRGPLAVVVDSGDVADSVALFLGEGGEYLNGQVLFVNGGRHLFSSQTA